MNGILYSSVILGFGIVFPMAETSGNNTTIWESLIGECSTASFRCVQDSLHRNLEATLSADFFVTDSISFRRNENKYSLEANSLPAVENADEEFDEWVNSVEAAEADYYGVRKSKDYDGKSKDDLRKSKPEEEKESFVAKSVGDVSDILYNKGLYYLMTHDLELGLPEMLFGGGRIKISPRGIEEDGGALVKINFEEPHQPEGRIFLKKIRQVFKKKLMTSFMAAMLIIKLIKVKLMFLLPLVVGVSAAKKILLKVLLFLFPALAHLFKLCAYYHHQHSKFHLHHHHQIAHHHHHPPPVYYPAYQEYSHPPPGAEIIHRSEQAGNELSSWGIEYQEDSPPISRVYNMPTQKNDDLLQVVPLAPSGPPIVPAAPIGGAPVAVTGTLVAAPAFIQPKPLEDNFYSPILKRLDRVFGELGFTEEPCKERLVCSMYKAPARFSPHSNLVSAEISRDPSELEKPIFSNLAVIRFYRYVEAARSGQEGKDCLALFPSCSLLTE